MDFQSNETLPCHLQRDSTASPNLVEHRFWCFRRFKNVHSEKKKKQTERRFLANHLPWCDPWGKFGRKKKGKCLLATLVAHNLKLFSDTTTFLALGRIGTQSYPVSWTELKRSIRDDGMFFFLKLQGLSTSVEPWCPHPFTHKPSRLYVNHPWFMTLMKWRPDMKKGCAETLRASSPAMAFLWIAHFSQEPTMWWEATSTP